MKLTHVTLHNFQAHKKLELELDKGITTLVGASDSGKSSVVRALQWTCLNTLSGDAFVRDGAKQAQVLLRTDQGTIVRERSSTSNIYKWNCDTFRSFGMGVPDAVSESLQVNSINFQSQHDPPFWFSESASEVSRQLNAIIDLSVIDFALSHVAARLRREQERVSLSEERLKDLHDEDLQGMEQCVQRFRSLEEKKRLAESLYENANSLSEVLDGARAYKAECSKHSQRAESGQHALQLARRAYEADVAFASLGALLERAASLHHSTKPPPEIGPLKQAHDIWIEARDSHRAMTRLVEELQQASQAVDLATKRLQDSEQRFHDETKGQACPLCGATL